MLARIRSYFTYANVTATAAVFLALGGTAIAVDGSLPGQNTVGSEDIIGNEVRSGDIANGRIFNVDIADDIIRSGKIKDNTLTGDDIDESSLGKVGDADTLDGLDSSAFTGGGGGGGATVVDGNDVTLGTVLTINRSSVTVLTSTGHQVNVNFDGTFSPAQIYYTGASCTGTAFLNDGGLATFTPPEFEYLSGKWVVFSGSQNTLMEPKDVIDGTAKNEEFTAATIDNPDCGPSAGQRSGWELKPITRAAAGLPNTIATPLEVE